MVRALGAESEDAAVKTMRPYTRMARVLCCLVAALCAARAPAAPDVFTGKFDAPSFEQYNPAYPGGGAAYCVPVSAADGAVWLAEHGWDLLPARGDEEALVAALAAAMQTDPVRGTTWSAAEAGLTDWLDDTYDPSRISVIAPDDVPPDPDGFAWLQEQVARPDTVAIIMRTTYLNLPGYGWGVYVSHGMFLAGYDALSPALWLHDPLVGEAGGGEPVGLVEHLDVRGRFEYYSFDLALSPPAGSPTGTEIEARWSNVLVFSIAAAGDADHDGLVDAFDLATLADNYHRPDVGWRGGDFNLDGVVDVMDLGILGTNYAPAGPPAGGQPVPEPVAAALLLIGSAAVLRRRR